MRFLAVLVLLLLLGSPALAIDLNFSTNLTDVNITAPDVSVPSSSEVVNTTKEVVEEVRTKVGEAIAGEQREAQGYFTSQSARFYSDDELIVRGADIILKGDSLIIVDPNAIDVTGEGIRAQKIANGTFMLQFKKEIEGNLTIVGLKTVTVTREAKTFNQTSGRYETIVVTEQQRVRAPIGIYALKVMYANGAKTPKGWISYTEWSNLEWWGNQGQAMYNSLVYWYASELVYNPPKVKQIQEGDEITPAYRYKQRAEELISSTIADAKIALKYQNAALLSKELKAKIVEILTTMFMMIVPGMAPEMNIAFWTPVLIFIFYFRRQIKEIIKGERRLSDFIHTKFSYLKLKSELRRRDISEGDWESWLKVEALPTAYAAILGAEDSPFTTPYITSKLVEMYVVEDGKDEHGNPILKLDIEKLSSDFEEFKKRVKDMRSLPMDDEIICKIFESACRFRVAFADSTADKERWKKLAEVCRDAANELAGQRRREIDEIARLPDEVKEDQLFDRQALRGWALDA